MPSSSFTYTDPMKNTVTASRDGAVDMAAEAAGRADVVKAKDIWDTANKTDKFGKKIEEMANRDPADFIEAVRQFRPAGDLAALLDSIPILSDTGIGIPTLIDVLEAIQEAVDDIVERAGEITDWNNPWDEPPTPPPPSPPSPPSGGSPWGPGGGGGADPFIDPPKDPLVLDLDGGGITLMASQTSGVNFDLDGNGFAERTGWIGSGEGFLIRDANGNGLVDGISEMFGDATTDGFDELKGLDSNNDGVINASDATFSSLLVWQDLDSDGVTDAGELQSLGHRGVTDISLDYREVGRVQAGNLVAREATFTGASGAATAATVWFGTQQVLSEYILPPGFVFDAEALNLPDLQGFGVVTSLRVAMTQSPTLRTLVAEIVSGAASMSYDELRERISDLLIVWSGADIVQEGSRGPNVDAQALEVLERFYGEDFVGGVNGRTGDALNDLFENLIDYMGFVFVSQVAVSATLIATENHEAELSNPFWGLASAGYDGSTSTISWDLGAIVERIVFEATINHFEETDVYLAQTAPWLQVLKDVIYGGNAAAFENALKYHLSENRTDNALIVAIFEAATGDDVRLVDASMTGGAGEELFLISGDATRIEGGDGSDAYMITRGSGSEIVEDYGLGGLNDQVLFEGRMFADALISVVDGDIIVRFVDDADVAVVINAGFRQQDVERYVFTDRSFTAQQLIAIAMGPDGTGDDTIRGAGTDDRFDAGAGNDYLIGGDGNDSYAFGLGSGHDIVIERVDPVVPGSSGLDDSVRIEGGLVAADLVFERAGADLLVKVLGAPDVLTIRGWFEGATIERLIFHTGGELTKVEIDALVVSTGVTITGTNGSDILESAATNDRLAGNRGSDTYIYEAGDGYDVIADSAYSSSDVGSQDTLVLSGIDFADVRFSRHAVAYGHSIVIDILGDTPGRIVLEKAILPGDSINGRIETYVFADRTMSAAEVEALIFAASQTDLNDIIYGYTGDDVFEGGLGDDIIRTGGNGRDTIVWSRGDGRDVIYDASDGAVMLHGVDPSDVTVVRQAPNSTNFELRIDGSMMQAVVIIGQTGDRIASVQFDNGEVWDSAEFIVRADGLHTQTSTHLGTGGTDTLSGGNGNDVLDGEMGADELRGGYGSDNYLIGAGDGDDLIVEFGGGHFRDVDAITFLDLASDEVIGRRSGYDLVLDVIGTNQTVTVHEHFLNSEYGIERVLFIDGVTLDIEDIRWFAPIRGNIGNDILGSDSGTYPFWGTNQTFQGDLGDDKITGGVGGDGYIWNTGDGDDTIYESGATADTASIDTLWLQDVSSTGVKLTWSGLDLLVTVLSTGETITIDWQNLRVDGVQAYGLERIRFADDVMWDISTIVLKAAYHGSDGDDYLYGSDNDDHFIGGLGDDMLIGREGSDRYEYAFGDGDDIIDDWGLGGLDTLVIDDVLLSDVQLTQEGEALLIELSNGDIIRVEGQFIDGLDTDPGPREGIEALKVGDVTLDRAAITTAMLLRTFDDVQFGSSSDDTLTGGEGASYLMGRSGADTITGGLGSDQIGGGDGDDVLHGGSGDDRLEGGAGDDTYVFDLNDGYDEILATWSTTGNDTLVFNPGILPDDISVSRSGYDLILTVSGGPDATTVRIQSQFDGAGVNQITFSGGPVWSRQEIQDQILAQSQTIGHDQIYGFDGDDVLQGGLGNDYLDGGIGNDTFLFNLGDGADIIEEFTGTGDTLTLGAGLDFGTLTLVRHMETESVELVFGSGDRVYLSCELISMDPSVERGVETINFFGGPVLTRLDLVTMLLAAGSTTGDDVIRGFSTNDNLTGLAGADAFDFTLGYSGDDIINDFTLSEDVLTFADWMFSTRADALATGSQVGSDVIFNFDGGSVTLLNVSLASLTEEHIRLGNEGNNVFEAGPMNQSFDGGAGNDTYRVSTYDNANLINEFAGYDRLFFEAGLLFADMVVTRFTEGDDSIQIDFVSTGTSIYIEGQLEGLGLVTEAGIEELVFHGGQVLTRMDLAGLIMAGASTDMDDLIEGFDSNDSLTGGLGVDTFVFSDMAFGHDVITDFASISETMYFSAWMFSGASDVLSLATQSGSDVVIITQYGSITLQNVLVGDLNTTNVKVGNTGDDVFVSISEDEYFEGGYGDDTFLFGPGGGADYIWDEAGANDRVVLDAGLELANMSVSIVNDTDMLISFVGGENLYIQGQTEIGGQTGIETLVFADNTSLDRQDLFDLAFEVTERSASLGMADDKARTPEPFLVIGGDMAPWTYPTKIHEFQADNLLFG